METTTIKSKICTKCKELKELSMFSKNHMAKDGYRSDCKSCVKIFRDLHKHEKAIWSKEYSIKNKDKLVQYNREYREKNKERLLERDRVYRESVKDKTSARGKEYRLRNKDRLTKERKEYKLKNRESILIKSKIYNENNKDKLKKYREKNKESLAIKKIEYYKKNKDKILKYKKEWALTEKGRICKTNSENKRRMIKANKSNGSIPIQVVFPYTDSLIQLLQKQDNKCIYCSCFINKDNMHLDHIVPLSKQGTHSIDNVQWLCATCNLQKGSKSEESFLKYRKK